MKVLAELILHEIRRQPGITNKQLASRCYREPQITAAVLGGLAKNGHVVCIGGKYYIYDKAPNRMIRGDS